jgi:hypothetical protein
MENKIKILLNLYRSYYPILIDTEILLKALKKLPQDLQLEPKLIKTALGIAPVEKRISERIVELERDQKILSARLQAIEEEIKSIPGGTEALKDWVWEPLEE